MEIVIKIGLETLAVVKTRWVTLSKPKTRVVGIQCAYVIREAVISAAGSITVREVKGKPHVIGFGIPMHAIMRALASISTITSYVFAF